MNSDFVSSTRWLPSIYLHLMYFPLLFYILVLIRCACESNGALWLTLKKLSFIRTRSEAIKSAINICVIQMNKHFKLAMAMRFSADLMWDVDNKTASNSDDVATVLMMAEMMQLDSLRDIKLALERNVARHEPCSPYLLLPNRRQWSFSTCFAGSRD